MSFRRRNPVRLRVGRHGALCALALTAVALACDDSEDRVPQVQADAGQGNVAPEPRGEAGDAATQGGQPPGGASPSLPAGSSAGEDAAAGAAGMTTETCDAACLASVVSQTSDFGMQWHSSWFLLGCAETFWPSRDCPMLLPCPNQDAESFADRGLSTLETFPIGGVPGRRYKITFTFNAVVPAKHYQGGTRDQGDQVAPNENDAVHDSFYRDGGPIPSNYSVWELAVFDELDQPARRYYMNAFPPGGKFESHRVFRLGYTKSIVVVGGGKVTHRVQVPNCFAIDNCSVNSDDGCGGSYYLPNEPADLALPSVYLDPVEQVLKPTIELSVWAEHVGAAQQPWHANLGHLTITSVEETDEPVTHDYL